MKIANLSSGKVKRSECVALVMALILLLGAFTVAIPSTIAQEPPGPPNPPFNVSESSSLRVYGEGNMGPDEGYDPKGQMIYSDWEDPFDPTVLQKDSITFSPAIILWDGQESPMSANSTNIHEKKYLRMWYEPEHIYTKPTYCHPTIEVESTYMLIDRQDFLPISGPENVTYFKFPIVEIPGQTGVGAFENEEGEPTRKNVVRLALVGTKDDQTIPTFKKTTEGKIRIEKTYTLMPDETVQFLDFKLQYKYIVVRDGDHYAKVKVRYAGNYDDDTETTVVLGQSDDGTLDDAHATTWFKRHIERYPAPDHSRFITWYARFEDEILLPGEHPVEITIGKEIQAGDTFYVNGVRYDIPAVEVIETSGDTTADEFKYITVRTPLPKGDGREVPDDNKTSSQWIVTVPPETVLPLNPPFNLQTYKMVDDINVVLWEPLKHFDEWPCGNPSGNPGTEYFPLAERYLTMQYPPDAWQYYFRAIPIDTDNDMKEKMPNDWQIWDGPYYPDDDLPDECWEVGVCGSTMPVPTNYTDFDEEHWIAYDVDERLLDVDRPLQVVYLDETEEPRYSTDLLEILNETGMGTSELEEFWTKYDIQTLPDRYTEFVLPALPDVETPIVTKPGDYLLTSSFLANNSIGKSDLNRSSVNNVPRVAFAYDVEYENGVGDGLDIYVNQWGGTSSIRIYGEDNLGPIQGYGTGTGDVDYGRALPYPDYWDPFDPTVLQKDSITLNPALTAWDGSEYPMSIGSINIDMKTFLRLWYEPAHKYSKKAYCRPTIEVETTYMPIDKQDKLPIGIKHIGTSTYLAQDAFIMFPIAEDESTDTPGLELIENPNSEPDRLNVVRVYGFYGEVTSPDWKSQNGSVRLQKTYKMDIGDKVQFLDHKLTFVGIVVHDDEYYAKVKVDYAGNRDDDTGTTVVLGAFDDQGGKYAGPHDTTWFKRHSETYTSYSHPDITWFARLENYHPDYDWAEITVGKQLQAGVKDGGEGDVFYVDGVRYDVAAIEVVGTDTDSEAEELKYITLRTPWPKCITTGVSSVPDDGTISSQWIECIPPYEPIPLLPPFNWDHTLIDDIDVELWEPLKNVDQWPWGDPSGNLGTEYFPLAERYLTMQYPPGTWQYYFRAVPLDTDNDMNPKTPNDWQIWDGPYYPGNVTEEVPDGWELGWCTKNISLPDEWTDFNKTAGKWIAHDVDERIIPELYDPLEIIYVDETIEPRYSTNLLEVLYENVTGTEKPDEFWTKYDIQTLPDLYTEFVLPKDEAHAGELLMNDYIITSSFLAPNSDGKSDLIRVPPATNDLPRVGFVFDAFDSLEKTGLYVNELVMEPPEPENRAPVLVIDVSPTTVTALETVTVDTAGTYDDQYPLEIKCDWDDGTVETAWMADNMSAPVFTHQYTKSDTYTVTVRATDKYNAYDEKMAPVMVTNDGAVLSFGYGWNAISAPVEDSTSMSNLFVTQVPGFYAVYSWDNSAQAWVPEDLSQPLDPTKGYLIWATDDAEVELTGTAATYSPSFATGWNLVGVGAEPVDLTSGYAYLYEHTAGTYIPTRTMEPGNGYFIYV